MKANFKPTQFTKKEWQDNRARAANGNGVGKALDEWQKKCPWNLNGLSEHELVQSTSTATKLEAALDKAKKACNKQKQKETIAGIEKYETIIKNYKKAVAEATKKAKERAKYRKEVNGFGAVLNDRSLMQTFIKWSKTNNCEPEAVCFVLLKSGKHKKAWDDYIKADKLNAGEYRKVFVRRFGQGDEAVTDKLLNAAARNINSNNILMLNTRVGDFVKSETFTEFLTRKFLIPTFTL